MSDEKTPCDHETLDRELRAVRELIEVRFHAAELSAQLVAEGIQTRLEGQNQWRAQLDRERVTFVQIEQFNAMDRDMRRLEAWQARVDGVLIFVRFLGIAGALGFLLTLVRMAKLLP